MEFRPCIDLHEGKVKQIVGSTLSDNKNSLVENFSTDKPPMEFVNLYKRDDLRGGHVIKLGNGNDEAAKEALSLWKDGFHIGGAINDENAKYWLDCGASHVIVTSFVFKDGRVNFDNLQKLKKAIKKERITLDLSCKKRGNKYYIVTDRWQKFTDEIIDEKSLDFFSQYCDEFLIHAADVEGKKQGADLELVEILAENVKIPTTYAGGISTMDDIKKLQIHGKNRINFTVGSALDIFGGNLNYSQVVEFCRQR
ncbi:MAG: phosphoribosylformimino-5-aminoimidazole carboxamide ribotide isomerase [Chitinispirillales bacterium]|nr:phosphoribosylformimino-5-aminoimidazole carboxamide ribotide isomerase [Chitinispirillales bacterium]